MKDALAKFGLELKPATTEYDKKGGRPYHLLQHHKGECSLVVHIKLTNRRGQKMAHFVGWDGTTIHDHPESGVIEDIDRLDKESSRKVFDKLYKEFKEWSVTTVYKLQRIE